MSDQTGYWCSVCVCVFVCVWMNMLVCLYVCGFAGLNNTSIHVQSLRSTYACLRAAPSLSFTNETCKSIFVCTTMVYGIYVGLRVAGACCVMFCMYSFQDRRPHNLYTLLARVRGTNVSEAELGFETSGKSRWWVSFKQSNTIWMCLHSLRAQVIEKVWPVHSHESTVILGWVCVQECALSAASICEIEPKLHPYQLFCVFGWDWALN